jgi:hypothetical protein
MIPLLATIEEPEQGTWVADLVHLDVYPGSFDMGGITWTGAALPSVQDGPRFKTRVVGGKGKLSATVPDKYYYGGGTGDTVIGDIARTVGETYIPGAPQRVASWDRAFGTGGQALDQICQTLGVTWWVDTDGQLRAGTRPAGAADLSKAVLLSADPDGALVYNTVSSKELAPGLTIGGKVIRHIRWELTEKNLTACVSFVPYALVDLRGGLDYLRSHRAVVESQEADGTLNLIVGNRFSLTKVPFQGGIPGKIKLQAGDVVTACAWGGDPRQWFAHSVQRVDGRVTIDCGTLLFTQLPVTPPGTGGTVLFVKQFLPGEEQALALAVSLVVPPQPWLYRFQSRAWYSHDLRFRLQGGGGH